MRTPHRIVSALALLVAVPIAGCDAIQHWISRARGTDAITDAGEPSVAVSGELPDVPSPRPTPPPARDAAVALRPDAAPPAPPPPALEDPETTPGPRVLAVFPFVPIYTSTDNQSPRIGYLRSGGRARVDRRPIPGNGCPRGWFRLMSGGYVCNSNFVGLEGELGGWRPPNPPDRSKPLPYPYYIALRNSVMYRRPPSEADMRIAEPERFPQPHVETPAVADADGGVRVAEADAATPTMAARVAPQAPAPAAVPDAGPTIEALQGDPNSPVLRRMLRGMYVSVDRAVANEGRTYLRTQSGGFVERDRVGSTSDRATAVGVPVDGQHPLPLAFMLGSEAWSYSIAGDGRSFTRVARVERFTAIPLTGDPPETIRGVKLYRGRDGLAYNERNIRLVRTTEPPPEVGAQEKWIEVNLDRQTLIAYEGPRPVFVTLVSTGRRSRDRLRNYETVQGAFRIYAKHVAATMDGDTASDGPYSIEDVPWVMYFHGSFALHGAFWHNGFGWVHSHGCVNLAPTDARWVFQWTAPDVPSSWHGAFATQANPGTRVYVHYESQPLGTAGGPAVIPPH